MITPAEALGTVLAEVTCLGSEQVPLTGAGGRVLAEAVRSTRDVPPFRNSAMDGYAVRAADVGAASRETPAKLRVREVVAAGTVPQQTVVPGTAIQVMTGSLMPEGADAVVRVEDTSADDDSVCVFVAVSGDANVRHPGEDVKAGDLVLEPGRVLRPADVGLLASLGWSVVRVRRRPEVAILATGDELVELGAALGPGQIVNSNAYTLAAAVEEAGARPRLLGIVRDTEATTRAAFADAFTSDMVLSTGGVSMGVFDIVRETLAGFGVRERFWKVAQKPGKPLTFGMRERLPVFGLPGNPVSALVCFYLYVRPALRAMMGHTALHLPVVRATLEEEIRTTAGLTEFVRCTLDGEAHDYRARSTGSQSSAVLRSLSLGHGLIVAPPGSGRLVRGSSVRVIMLTDGAAATPPV
jgi:molybdopterin molybdotransferase